MFEKLGERYTKIFERPSPVIYCDTEVIEGSSSPGWFDGYFIVKNVGGGNLEGDIFAQSSFINLLQQTVEGNDVIIEYEMDLSHLNPGDVFISQIVLTTSGGQFVIPVKILIEPHSIKCGMYKIHNLKDFGNCVRLIPDDAIALFSTQEFEQWLVNSKCAHMAFYHKLTEGGAGLRQIDSFLIACGLKEKAAININEKDIKIPVRIDGSVTLGYIPISRTTWGHFEYTVSALSKAPWLKLPKSTLANGDFEDDELLFPVEIDTERLYGAKSFETLVFKNNQERIEVKLTALKPKLFTVRPSRKSFGSEDSGFLICHNHTGKNAVMEVAASENFVRFKAAKYVVEDDAEIPFEIKVNSFLNLGIGKRPVNVSNIYLRSVIDGKVYKETITIRAGSLLNVRG